MSTTANNSFVVNEAPTLYYEKRLDGDRALAMTEGSLFFQGKGSVQNALRKITSKLNELGIDYAVVGGMALFSHGFRRYTEDVDILVTREANELIHQKLTGLGYLPPFTGSKHLRDTENGVKVEFLITGGFPGDGKPKPVAFPNPKDASEDRDGIRYLTLPALIELKLASGMTGGVHRFKDLGDVVQVVKALNIPLSFSEQLNEYVRPKFIELWNELHSASDPHDQ